MAGRARHSTALNTRHHGSPVPVPRNTPRTMSGSRAPEAGPQRTGARRVGTLLSVNVGLPKDVPWQGRTVFTGVFKDPVTGPRHVGRLNVAGDGQGDLGGHGGGERARFVVPNHSYPHLGGEPGRGDFAVRPVRGNITF